MKPRLCPHCGAFHTAFANAEYGSGAPEPGPDDVGLCFACGGWMVFTEDQSVRKPTAGEMIEIAFDWNCQQARAAWAGTMKGILTKTIKGIL